LFCYIFIILVIEQNLKVNNRFVVSETISTREAPLLLQNLVPLHQHQIHPVLERVQQPQHHIVLQQQQHNFQHITPDSALNGLISSQQEQHQQHLRQLQTYPILQPQAQQPQLQPVPDIQQYSESKALDNSSSTEDNVVK
jgi:hypothetical protein